MNILTTPNVRAMESLRHVGYSNEAAIADLVDNSIDAGATQVIVDIDSTKIAISDDGSGMTREIVEEAIKLGSNTQRAPGDLGKFGMGLVTASLSLGRKLIIQTEVEKATKSYIVTQDLDDMIKKNEYSAVLKELPSSSKAGTTVIIQKLTDLKYKPETLAKRAAESLAQTFRHYIKAGKSIVVNGTKLEANDPLMLEEGAELYSDDTYDVNGKVLRIKIAYLPELSREEQRRRNINARTQGFYLVRNSREIIGGVTLGQFTRDYWYSRIRIELMFSDELDTEFGIDFTKSKLSPQHALRDLIREATWKQIRHLSNRTKSAKELSSDNSTAKHEESEQTIKQKSKLLVLPKGNKERREMAGGSGIKRNESTNDKERRNVTKTDPNGEPRLARGIEITEGHLSQFGPIFYCHMVGQKTILEWNYDHPFYEKMLLRFKEDKDVITALDYLAYSLGVAEMTVQTEASEEVFNNYHSVAASNLRTLLS